MLSEDDDDPDDDDDDDDKVEVRCVQTLHVYDNRSSSRAASIYAYLPPEPVVGFNISHPRLLFLALRAPKRTLWAASIYAYLPPEPGHKSSLPCCC